MIFFYITYAIAWFLLFAMPDYPLIAASNSSTYPIPLSTFCILYIIVGGWWWLRQHKEHPIIGPIYTVVNAFFIVLFATLLFGYAKEKMKDEFKDWTGK